MIDRRLLFITTIQVFVFSLFAGIGIWWSRFILNQTKIIDSLKGLLNQNAEEIKSYSQSIHRMVFWEAGTYIFLMFILSGLLLWMYWRESIRAKSLGAFFASVTHELKTPLTSIRLQAETLEEENPASKNLQRLLNDTLRLETQVERVLELARVEGGGAYFLSPISLKQTLERSIKPWAEATQGKLTIETNLIDIEVLADSTAMSVIVKNLLENSLKHGLKSSGTATQVGVSIKAENKNGQVYLEFSDSGAGYEGNQKKLGELFFKGKNSQGAGVGLYLVKTLMKRMKGEAHFENVRGFRTILVFQEARHG